jgi:hypothetical protein
VLGQSETTHSFLTLSASQTIAAQNVIAPTLRRRFSSASQLLTIHLQLDRQLDE